MLTVTQQPDNVKIYLYIKYLFEPKYHLLINRREKLGIEKLKNPKAFTDYPQTIYDVLENENLEDYSPTKKRNMLIFYIAVSPIVTELFIIGRKRNISLVFISQSYFKVPKTVRINATHYFIMKISNNRELKQIASTHSSDTEFKIFMKLYKDYTKAPYSFLVNNITLPSDNPLRFRKNLL